jgi:hypothetical protein
MISQIVVRQTLRAVLSDGARRLVDSSPTAAAFARDPAALEGGILIRHMIEHVHRIRMFRSIDALAERQLRTANAAMADAWARYGRSESVHDRYFLRDLAAAGVDRETVDGMPQFPATVRLGRFAELAAREHGPVAVVLYSFWAEENSDVGSNAVILRTRELFGDAAVRGAMAHRKLDEAQDHGGVISAILADVIQDTDDLLAAARLLGNITGLIGEYFAELHTWSRRSTVGVRRTLSTVS